MAAGAVRLVCMRVMARVARVVALMSWQGIVLALQVALSACPPVLVRQLAAVHLQLSAGSQARRVQVATCTSDQVRLLAARAARFRCQQVNRWLVQVAPFALAWAQVGAE